MTLAYIPITLTNNESTATATSFQQLLQNINMRDYFQFLNPDLSNTYFSSDSAGSTVINSWIESGNTNISTDTTFWVVTSIAANSTITIYLQVDLSGTNHLNTTTTGVAPQLTSTYAEYDNGADVFNYYQRWGGLSALPGGWTNTGLTATFSATSTAITGTSRQFIYTTNSAAIAYPQTVDFYMNVYGNGEAWFGYWQTAAPTSDVYTYSIGETATTGTTNVDAEFFANSGTATSYTDTNNAKIYSIEGITSTSVNHMADYTTNIYSNTAATSFTIAALQFENNGGAGYTDLYWLRTRATPPNGVMPSVSLGTPSGFPYVNTTSSVTEVLDF